jgi:hypothetical protein
MIIFGLRFYYWTIAQGVFFCRKCGTDRNYRHRKGRRFFHIFWIPLIPLPGKAEHVQCTTCKTRYVPDVLQVPATAQPGIAPQPAAQPATQPWPQQGPPPGTAPQPAPPPGTTAQPGTQPGTGSQPPWWA